MALKLTSRTKNGVTILDCSGRIVFGEEANELRKIVKALYEKSKRIILNLSDVKYIDSGGLGTLVGLLTSAKSKDVELKLLNLSPKVNNVFRLTRLITVFAIYEKEDQALDAFASKTSIRH